MSIAPILDITFKGKTFKIKPPSKYSDFQKDMIKCFPQLQQQSWNLLYQDQDGDNIMIQEKQEYQNMISFMDESKKNLTCQIEYRTDTQLEESKHQFSDSVSSSSAEESPAQIDSESEQEQHPKFQIDGKEIKTEYAATEQQQDLKSRTDVNTIVENERDLKLEQKLQRKLSSSSQQSSAKPESSSGSESDQEMREKPKNEGQVINQEDKIPEPVQKQVHIEGISKQKLQQGVKKNDQPQDQKLILQSAVFKKQVQDQPNKVFEGKTKHKAQRVEVKMEVESQPQRKRVLDQNRQKQNGLLTSKHHHQNERKVQIVASSPFKKKEDQSITISLEEYSRLKKLQQINAEKCAFCASQELLNQVPLFQNLLICDSCNERFEVKLRVKTHRSRNPSSASSQMKKFV